MILAVDKFPFSVHFILFYFLSHTIYFIYLFIYIKITNKTNSEVYVSYCYNFC